MGLLVAGREIERVSIVDDDGAARQGYEYSIEDLELIPIQEVGPLGQLETFLARTAGASDAAICDHHLRKRNYAQFNGAEAVAAWYRHGFPALLCTRYETAEIEEIRRYRRWIPVLMKPDHLDPTAIENGLFRCIAEFGGEFQPSRRPWRTLIRVDDVVEDGPQRHWFGAIVPAWDHSEVVRVWFDQVPPAVRDIIAPDVRLHAEVNIGAEDPEEIYFSNWETS
jgi:hypothetical protein